MQEVCYVLLKQSIVVIALAMNLLASNGNNEESSQSEPLLIQNLNSQESGESSVICEITPAEGNLAVVDHDLQNVHIDETCHLVNIDQPQCRICLDIVGEDFIAPCHCKGTQKYVHRSCLDNWRSTKEGLAFSRCTECKAEFIFRVNIPPDQWWLRLKFKFLVARDHAFLFIIILLVVALMGLLLYKLYGEELKEIFGYNEHPYVFYAFAALAIYYFGFLYGGFTFAAICNERINKRHYHVLVKQELTEKYVVEDREHMKSVPELDPNHVAELKKLGLY